MNAKERIMMVMRGEGIPDRVPVSIGISEAYPVRFTTGDYLEFYHYNPVPLWQARADIELKFGGDNFIHWTPQLKKEFQIEEKKVIEEGKNHIIYGTTLHTPEGELTSRLRLGRKEGFSTVEPYVKNLKADFGKMLYLLPEIEKIDIDDYRKAYDYIGPTGSMAPCIEMPVDWLSGMMGGPEKMIMAHFEFPDLFLAFTGHYTDWCFALLGGFIRKNIPMDVIQLGGACHSYSVTSPDFFDRYGVPFINKLLALEKSYPDKILLQQHTCGKSLGVLQKCHTLGMRAFEPLEQPPSGDVDLKEAKKLFGRNMCLKGNLNSISTMFQGTPEKVREETKKSLAAGMPGGRYYCAVGDQIPYQTPPENVEAFIETVMEYGKY